MSRNHLTYAVRDGELFLPGEALPTAIMRRPVFNFSCRKVGGLRFIRIGRLCLSFCITRKEFPQ